MAASFSWRDAMLSILRMVTAFLFLLHGTTKILHVPHVARYDHLKLLSLSGVAGMLELVGGTLLVLGLFTRPVAFILSGMMAVAYFQFHAPGGFWPSMNGGVPAVLYCFVLLYFSAAGSGPWSLDALRTAARPRDLAA